jgi:hypothetical protein
MATVAKPLLINSTFTPMSARRLLVLGGIALVAVGMLFGDIFAVFILHQNAGAQGAALIAANQAVAAGDEAAVNRIFASLGSLLEDRGTKVDAHVHMIGAGYLALMLALVQPFVVLRARTKKILAALFIAGGTLLPIGIFLIHYIGLMYSPFAVIGWASILADSAGALLIIVLAVEAWGFRRYIRTRELTEPALPEDNSWERRPLLSGGTLFVLLGFLHGAWYAGAHLYQHEQMETAILQNMITAATANDLAASTAQVSDFGNLAGARAVNIAAHSHVIEFGLLAMLLSFVQPYVFLSERWKRRWTQVLLSGSLILPIFVLLELKLGLLAGGIADIGGLMVIVALVAMLVGVLRYSGKLDASTGGAS